jgi:hypothetical protein
MPSTRGSLVWLGMVAAGLALAAYVLAAWPESSPGAEPAPKPVRATASLSYPESELSGVAGAFYPEGLYRYVFEPGTTPALDTLLTPAR